MRPVDGPGPPPDIADELYTLPPAQFTTARDAAAASARRSGDRETAQHLAALRRPTQGAHLVNLLALRRPDVVADLIALGEQIRDVQGTAARAGGGGASAADLRALSTRRRAEIAAALRVCRSLAAEAGSGEPTEAQLAEAESTLAAAMADHSAADLVRSGRADRAGRHARRWGTPGGGDGGAGTRRGARRAAERG